MSEAKEFVNVAFAISHMNAALWFAKQGCRLPQIFEPSKAFLLLDRNACRIDLALECVTPFKLLPGPELDCCQTQRNPSRSDSKARVHQDPANCVHWASPVFVFATRHLVRRTDQLRALSFVREFRRILQYQYGAFRCNKPAPCRFEVAAQDILFADPGIREKPISCFRVAPVLKGHWYALPHT